MFDVAFSEVKAKEQYFSELDAQTGDGDHGTAIVCALNAVNNSMKQASDLKMMFTDAGFAAMPADQHFDHVRHATVLARRCFSHGFLDAGLDTQVQRRNLGLSHALHCILIKTKR